MFLGTILTGINNVYAVTNQNALMIVTRVYSETEISVTVIDCIGSNTFLGDSWSVRSENFREITIEEWVEYSRAKMHSVDISELEKRVESLGYSISTNVTDVEMPTLMDHSKSMQYSEENLASLTKEAIELLKEYKYHNVTENAVRSMMNEWAKQKGWIDLLLSKHENYIPEKHMVVFKHDFEEGIDKNAVNKFVCWVLDRTEHEKYVPEVKIDGLFLCEAREKRLATRNVVRYMTFLEEAHHSVLVDGQDCQFWKKEDAKYEALLNRFDSETEQYYNKAYDKALFMEHSNHRQFFSELSYINSSVATKEIASTLNELAKPFDLRAVEGQKISRIVNKFCKYLKLNDIVEMGLAYNGNEKNYGYDYQFSQFSDGINTLKVTRYTVISVNPIDYLTMSFGHKWASCHTIDKMGIRPDGDEDHHYGGCYSSGTVSYMLDPTSFVVYTVDSKYNGTDFELQDKMKRVMFYLGEDKLIESRVYPDGRRNSEAGIDDQTSAKQFREIVQKVIADCLDTPNLWTTTKGYGTASRYIQSATGSTHYPDYCHYDDVVTSWLSRTRVSKNIKKIIVGSEPICPACGERHNNAENILCWTHSREYGHEGEVTCSRCGCLVSEEDAIMDIDTGNYYCDHDCAERDEVYYCDNVGEWHSKHVYCDHNGDYFYDLYDFRIIAEDGEIFQNEEQAEECGYHYNDDLDEWTCD